MLGRRRSLDLGVAVFLSMVCAPLVPLGARFLGSPVDSPLLLAAAFLSTALIGYLGARQVTGIETTVSTWPGFGVLVGPPLVYSVLAIVVLLEAAFDSLLWVGVGVMSGVAGLIVVGLGYDARTRAAVGNAKTYASWDGRAPRNQRRALIGLSAVVCLGTLGFMLTPQGDPGELFDVAAVLLLIPVVTSGLVAFRNQKKYQITDIGFVNQGNLQSWENYEGYRIEEDTVVLETASRIGSSLRFDRSDIDDEAAVRDALERVFGPAS